MDFVFDLQKFADEFTNYKPDSITTTTLTELAELSTSSTSSNITDYLTGQFSWTANRAADGLDPQALVGVENAYSAGFIQLKGFTAASITSTGASISALGSATVDDQPAKTSIAAPKSGYNAYLVTYMTQSGEYGLPTLNLASLVTVSSTGAVTVIPTESLGALSGSNALSCDITINAPDTAISFAKPEIEGNLTVNLNLKKVAADSSITGLGAGDNLATAALATGDTVSISNTTYTSGSDKNVLTFVGESVKDNNATTNYARLYSGSVLVSAGGNGITLAGSRSDIVSDDILVAYSTMGDGPIENIEPIVVTASKGVVSNIKGLSSEGYYVVVEGATAKVGNTTVSPANIRYEVMDDEGTMIKRTILPADSGVLYDSVDPASANVTYLTLAKAGGDIYGGSYKAAALTEATDFSATAGFDQAAAVKSNATYYFRLGQIVTSATKNAETLASNLTLGTAAEDEAVTGFVSPDHTSKAINDSFLAVGDNYYLQVKATTTAGTATKPSVTTINGVTLMKAAANGALSAVKANEGVYTGTLTIPATPEDSEHGALVNYKLPAPTSRSWKLALTGAALGSEFTNLGEGDVVSTFADEYKLAKGTYTVYTAGEGGLTQLSVSKVTVAGDGVTATVDDEEGLSITNFATNKEKVTVATSTLSGTTNLGLVTDVYESSVANNAITITKTTTDAEGRTTKGTNTTAISSTTADTNILGLNYEPVTTDAKGKTVYATYNTDFDWTLNKSGVGYFAIDKKGNATLKAGTLKDGQANDYGYLRAAVGENGAVTITKVYYDATAQGEDGVYGVMTEDTDNPFLGGLTINASKTKALTFDRTNILAANSVENFAITLNDLAAGSTVSGFMGSDVVKTTKLAVGESVSVNAGTARYTAAAAGSLSFAFGDEEGAMLTGGTILLAGEDFFDEDTAADTAALGETYVKAGALVRYISVEEDDSITVSVSGNKFTLGDLQSAEEFQAGEYSYVVSNGTIFRETDKGIEVCTLKNTIDSSVLEDSRKWTLTTNTFNADGTSDYGTATVDLALADKRIAADAKTVDGVENTYNFVYDTYTKLGTTRNQAAKLNAVVTNEKETHGSIHTKVGEVSGTGASATSVYQGLGDYAQNIKAADGWKVTGSDNADTLTGAAKGKDILNGGSGDDTLAGGNAEDWFVFSEGFGKDTVTNYASGKDRIFLVNEDMVTFEGSCGYFTTYSADLVAGTNDVLLTSGDNTVTLKKMGNGKAVTINGNDWHFGDASSSKGATFNYVEGDFYVGNTSGSNTLKVGTDKTKATKTTLGQPVFIDLDATANGIAGVSSETSLYTNINTVDASSSANEVVLAASDNGSTLKGGTYVSTLVSGGKNDTLVGGSGADTYMFIAEGTNLAGQDVIEKYDGKKDALQLGGTLTSRQDTITELNKEESPTIAAVGKDVVIKNGDNTITIKGAVGPNNAINFLGTKTVETGEGEQTVNTTVAYYVGKVGAANKFTTFDNDSHYVGSTGVDTLTLGKNNKGAVINLNDTSKYASIDVINASAVSYDRAKDAGYVDTTKSAAEAKASGYTKVGADITAGTTAVSITGTKYNDTITCGTKTTYNYASGTGTDTVNNFSTDDVIQFNNLKSADIAALNNLNGTQVNANNPISVSGGVNLNINMSEDLGDNSTWQFDSKNKTLTVKASST